MITRILYDKEKPQYDQVIKHPVQTWVWGDFQISQGHKVYRLGTFEKNKIISGYTISFHQIPKIGKTIGTILRGPKVDQEMIANVTKIALEEKAIFVKFEPDIYQKTFDQNNNPTSFDVNMDFPGLQISPKVAFYPYSYLIDLTKSEDELLSAMHPKTRYNVKIANRHNVKIELSNTDETFEIYLKLLFDTTRRQGFYLHSENYHRKLWQLLKPTGIPRIMLASYQGEILSAFMLFVIKDKLFYPYGASSNSHREVMAPTLLMWECIKYGQSLKLKLFDMWGSLGPDAKESDQGFGFHRFKQGYGGQLVQYIGTYDLIIDPNYYRIYNLVDKYRWQFLRLKAKIFR